MVAQKTWHRFTQSLLIALACAAAFPLLAQAETWHSLTSYRDVREATYHDDLVWMATGGGLLATNSYEEPGLRYTNVDGLGTTDVTGVVADRDGQVWLAGDGRLIKFFFDSPTVFPIADNEGESIRLECLADDGDQLWIGSEIGLLLFSKTVDGGQLMDDFRQYGTLNPEPTINDIVLVGDSIWLATSDGIAATNYSNPLLMKAPANWRAFNMANHPELSSSNISDIASLDGSIIVGNSYGAFVYNPVLDVFQWMSETLGGAVTDLVVDADSLLIFTTVGAFSYRDGVTTSIAFDGVDELVRTVVAIPGGYWVICDDGTMYEKRPVANEFPYTGMPDNDVTDISLDANGNLSVLFRYEGLYDAGAGDQWTERPVSTGLRAEMMERDRFGQRWVATFGPGAYRVGDTIALYDYSNSGMQGAEGFPTTTVCLALAVSEDYFFGCSMWAYDGNPVAIGDLDNLDNLSGWVRVGMADGVTNNAIGSIDHRGQTLALGSDNVGVYYYYYGPDPFDKSDDSVAYYHESFGQLISDEVRWVKFMSNGELWVATNFGLSRGIFVDRNGNGFFVDVDLPAGLGPDINIIDYDARDNVWIGATNGLGKLDATTGTWTIYNTANSGLIHDNVFRIRVDQLTGDVYACTERGLSILRAIEGPVTETVENVLAYPNPFVIDGPDDELNFNFAGQATLSVYTVAGELVATRLTPRWDGLNDFGEPVVSGAYIFVLRDEDGNLGRGKVLLVRGR